VERLRTVDASEAVDPVRLTTSIATEISGLLGGALAAVYRPARVAEDWIVGAAGPRAPILSRDLAKTATSAAHWFRYDPLRPAPTQRNVVWHAERADAPDDSGRFFDRLGRNLGQTRILLCDGPVLLAWIGILGPPDARRLRDEYALRKIAVGARKRLRLALGVPPSLVRISFEASLDAYPGEAYVVRENGRVQYANELAAARIIRDPIGLRRALAVAVRGGSGAASGFDVQPLRSSGIPPHYLVTRRAGCVDLEARLRHAGARWGLTPRQIDVLGRLALGDANKEIAARFAMSVRTVEQHVATILERAKADSRLRLVARVWAG
jgi:DNA-binding CsgD family transcriptional regulator